MKSAEIEIVFTKEDVSQFVQLLGDQNPIYKSAAKAKEHGFPSIPLPPTMPMIAYKRIETPWQLKQPLIHRKQQCFNYETLYIDRPYNAIVTLENQHERRQLTFVQQTLLLFDHNRTICFKAISQLITGGLL